MAKGKVYIYGRVTQEEEDNYRARGLNVTESQEDYLFGILNKEGWNVPVVDLRRKLVWKFAERLVLATDDIEGLVMSRAK